MGRVSGNSYNIIDFHCNTPGGHNDELHPDGFRRADRIVRFVRDADADTAGFVEFHRLLATGWRDLRPAPHDRYPLYQAEFNGHAPNGSAMTVNRLTCAVEDFQSVPFDKYNIAVGLIKHLSTGSKHGKIVYHVPRLADSSATFRGAFERRVKEIADSIVEELRIPAIVSGDRNNARVGIWGLDGYETCRADVQWTMVRKGHIVYYKKITAAHGIITDHSGALKTKISMPQNKSPHTNLGKIL